MRIEFSFATDTAGWTADFTDYSVGMEPILELVSGIRRLPAPLADRSGLLLGGTNRSDDLFMYITRPVTGLVPNRRYRVSLQFTFATNVPAGCAGIGGAPGESVYVKAGATATEPMKVTRGGRIESNIDKGGQATSGRDVVNVGDFTGGGGSCGDGQGVYRLKTLSTQGRDPLLTSDASGRLWLVIGTDSGFEGRTEIYYLDGVATLTPE